MDSTLIQLPLFSIAGMAIRTENAGGKAKADIGALWQQFMQQQVAQAIPNRQGDDIYCMYTNYESDANAPYTVILGCKVTTLDGLPAGITGKSIPAHSYRLFAPTGSLPDSVVSAWVYIWQSDISRAYAADFDVYKPDGRLKYIYQSIHNNMGIKIIMAVTLAITVCGCNQSAQIQRQQARIDSLQKQLNDAYKPGLGEFMSSIQVHHAKLYFAGQHSNWGLADFEIHEIMESLDDIAKYAADRPEAKLVPLLNPALDSLNAAIAHKNLAAFNNGFVILTNTCNKCHQAVHYEFNKVQIPSAPPYTNQQF